MTITILTVGVKNTPEFQAAIDDYCNRLPRSVDVQWRLLKPFNSRERSTTVHKESEKILSCIPDKTYVVLLDERGTQLSNTQLSEMLFSRQNNICIIIGGAYGVNQSVHDRSDKVVSLSSLVLPHKLVRLVLAEQIYRSHAIATGHPYHHS